MSSASRPRGRRLSLVWTVVSCTAWALVASSCAGCSEECSDTKQGSEGCPCSSDQECTTRLGEVLLCQEGVCKPGDPPDAPAQSCEQDADCGNGERCGLGLCSPAPSCQRLDVERLSVRMHNGAVLNPARDIAVTRDQCAHNFVSDDVTFTADSIHPATGVATVAGDCDAGGWFASKRAGVFSCGGDIAIVADGAPCLVNAASPCETGTCEAIGSPLDENAGVCR